MILLTSLLIFSAVTVTVILAYSFVHGAFFAESQRMRERVEEEFRTSSETGPSPVFKSLENVDINRPPSLLEFAPPRMTLALYWERARKAIERSHLRTTVRQVFGISLALGAAVGIGATQLAGLLVGCASGIAVATIPSLYVRHRIHARREKMIGQLPHVFDLMARVLRSGQSITQALQAVGDTCETPISKEFAQCQKQQDLGLTPETSYKQMADRLGILEIQIFVMAMTIQRQAGGNLADVLERLAQLLRDRERLRKHVRTLTAEGRLQGVTLFVLPFLVFAAMMVVNPTYAKSLFDHVPLIVATVISMTLGLVWIRRIVNVDY